MKTVQELGEDALIQRICKNLGQEVHVLTGPGDDCAVIETGTEKNQVLSLLKTDAVVEGVHFLAETSAQKVGWKATGRVLSDFASMGGEGKELLVTLAIPGKTPVNWVDELYQGMSRCASTFGVSIVGGETTAVPEGSAKVISVAGRGEVARSQIVLRSGGEPGDALFVTGRLGGSLAGWHLTFLPRIKEARWLVEHFSLTAMMDLSDGLARDLPRLAAASGCGFELDRAAIPRNRGCSIAQALGDGEDFELLFAVPSQSAKQLQSSWPKEFPLLTRIGSLTSSGGELRGGWGHFEACEVDEK